MTLRVTEVVAKVNLIPGYCKYTLVVEPHMELWM